MATTDKKLHVVGIGGTLREGSRGVWALEEALRSAEEAGAATELVDLGGLALPMYEPGKPLEEYAENVRELVEAMRGADALLWSTAAYFGTLAGLTKNALDFAQCLARDERPLPTRQVVVLIATISGGMGAVNAINAMVSIIHALRGVAAPLSVSVTQSWKAFDEKENIRDEGVARRLESLGRLVVEMAAKLGSGARETEERTLQNIA